LKSRSRGREAGSPGDAFTSEETPARPGGPRSASFRPCRPAPSSPCPKVRAPFLDSPTPRPRRALASLCNEASPMSTTRPSTSRARAECGSPLRPCYLLFTEPWAPARGQVFALGAQPATLFRPRLHDHRRPVGAVCPDPGQDGVLLRELGSSAQTVAFTSPAGRDGVRAPAELTWVEVMAPTRSSPPSSVRRSERCSSTAATMSYEVPSWAPSTPLATNIVGQSSRMKLEGPSNGGRRAWDAIDGFPSSISGVAAGGRTSPERRVCVSELWLRLHPSAGQRMA